MNHWHYVARAKHKSVNLKIICWGWKIKKTGSCSNFLFASLYYWASVMAGAQIKVHLKVRIKNLIFLSWWGERKGYHFIVAYQDSLFSFFKLWQELIAWEHIQESICVLVLADISLFKGENRKVLLFFLLPIWFNMRSYNENLQLFLDVPVRKSAVWGDRRASRGLAGVTLSLA